MTNLQKYESAKRELQRKGLDSKTYEAEIKKLAKRFKI
jgi:hypothetical protein